MTSYTLKVWGLTHDTGIIETEDLIHMLKNWGLTHDTGIYRD